MQCTRGLIGVLRVRCCVPNRGLVSADCWLEIASAVSKLRCVYNIDAWVDRQKRCFCVDFGDPSRNVVQNTFIILRRERRECREFPSYVGDPGVVGAMSKGLVLFAIAREL